MRDRTEIEKIASEAMVSRANDRAAVLMLESCLEVLLDIRDLLAAPKPTKREAVKQ